MFQIIDVNKTYFCKEFFFFFKFVYLTRQEISYTLVYSFRLDHMLKHVFRCTLSFHKSEY